MKLRGLQYACGLCALQLAWSFLVFWQFLCLRCCLISPQFVRHSMHGSVGVVMAGFCMAKQPGLTQFVVSDAFSVRLHCRLKPEHEQLAVTDELLNPDGSIKFGNYPNYLFFGRGPLATTGCDRGAFVNTRGKLNIALLLL